MIPQEEIAMVAKCFAKGILNKRPSKDMCFMVSAALNGYLEFMGVPSTLQEGTVYGKHHFWIDLGNGLIIDATADQFKDKKGNHLKNIWACKKPKFYKNDSQTPSNPSTIK